MIKFTTNKEVIEIKDFTKNGDEIKVEFTNEYGQKRFYIIRVTAKGNLVQN